MTFAHLQVAALTDVGRVRDGNEDAYLCRPAAGLFLLADGMGGAAAGEVASALVVEQVGEAFAASVDAGPATRVRRLLAAVNQASAAIRHYADQAGLVGTGTTVATLLFDPWHPGQAMVLAAGDSRVYRWRRGKLERLTNDHTVAAAAGVDDERELPPSFRGVLTRAAGIEPTVALETRSLDVYPQDIFLLCSDGLTRMIPDKLVGKLIAKHRNAELDELARQLVAAANAAGGLDNVTTILVRVAPTLPTAHQPTPAESLADQPTAAAAEADPHADPPTPPTATPPTDPFHNRPSSQIS